MPQRMHRNLLSNVTYNCSRCRRYFSTLETFMTHQKTCQRCKTSFRSFHTREENRDHSYGEKVCLLYSYAAESLTTLVVADMSKDPISEECFNTIALPFWIAYPGLGSLGMKCYYFGGDNRRGEEPDKRGLWLPRDVYVCDLSCKKLSWKNGPKLQGGKPDPISFTVNKKLYALAGSSDRWKRHEKLESLFEVFDPMHGTWRVLPEPPFISVYKKGSTYPRFKGHTVVGSIIYLKIGMNIGNPILFSFNVDTEKWHEHRGECYDPLSSAGSDELILRNLRNCTWNSRADVVNYLMFQTSGDKLNKLNVFAYDLTSNVKHHYDRISKDLEIFEENQEQSDSEDSDDDTRSNFSEIIKEKKENNNKKTIIGWESNSPKTVLRSKIGKDKVVIRNKYDCLVDFNDDSESKYDKVARPNKYDMLGIDIKGYDLVKNDRVVTVPVFGLTLIDRDIPPKARDLSFVTHLRDNLYSLVSYYSYMTDDYKKKEHVNVCFFEASFIELSDGRIEMMERVVAANNVKELNWDGSYLGLCIDWCKVPNDGHQSQFRRPQMQSAEVLSPYPDNVAGRVVHEKDTSQYLRVVDRDSTLIL